MPFDVYRGKSGGLIKAFTRGVMFDFASQEQVRNIADMPFVFKHVAVMPDVHLGKGATVGSVIPTKNAVIPAAVGVDIGCGMCAVKTTLTAKDLPDDLSALRSRIEELIPVGFGEHGNQSESINDLNESYRRHGARLEAILTKHPKIGSGGRDHPSKKAMFQAGSLGGGNHFIEICLDEFQNVWVMLHSGSRGIGNQIGTYFIEKAREYCERNFIQLADRDLAYLVKGDSLFTDYMEAVEWGQEYAAENRRLMLMFVLRAMREVLPPFVVVDKAVNCHHNYVTEENHFGEDVLVTRKGAVNAEEGRLGIIPGSMGTRSYIVRGLGNKESFCSCSHGAGRMMSRGEAKRRITLEEHAEATKGVECRKDESVLDESPAAYKNIDSVMEAQSDLVEIVATLKQVLCVKG